MTGSRLPLRIAAVMAIAAAGTVVVAQAANLNLRAGELGAVRAAVPTCASGSTTVTATTATRGNRRNLTAYISSLTLTLTGCAGAAAGDTLWWELDDTSSGSIGTGSCTLAGSPPTCTTSRLTAPTLASYFYGFSFDTITVEVVAAPAATGPPATGGSGMTLVSEYLTLATCQNVAEYQMAYGYAC